MPTIKLGKAAWAENMDCSHWRKRYSHYQQTMSSDAMYNMDSQLQLASTTCPQDTTIREEWKEIPPVGSHIELGENSTENWKKSYLLCNNICLPTHFPTQIPSVYTNPTVGIMSQDISIFLTTCTISSTSHNQVFHNLKWAIANVHSFIVVIED